MGYPCSDCGTYCDPPCEAREKRQEEFCKKIIRDRGEDFEVSVKSKLGSAESPYKIQKLGEIGPWAQPLRVDGIVQTAMDITKSGVIPEKDRLDLIEQIMGAPVPPLHKVLGEVEQERLKQNKKWGEQNHHPAEWLMILGEEVGEANKAALETNFKYPENDGWKSYREELVQVAAVAVAMIESLDRNQLKNQAQSEGEPKREPCGKCVNGRVGHECIDNCLCEEGHMDCWECDGNGYKEVK